MHPNELVINDYVDGALAPDDRAAVERHLAACDACRRLVDDLRALAQATRALTPIEPPAGVWRRVERELKEQPRAGFQERRPTHRLPYWLAAAAVLALATWVGVRVSPLSRRTSPPVAGTASSNTGVSSGPAAPDALSVETELRQAEEHYDKAIKGLEQIADANQGALDAGTAATLHKNLAVIDQAIGESRAAVHAQPNSEPAQQSLLENFRTKIAVLQDTVALINEMRKGNEAGAARIVSGLKEKGD